MFFPTLAVFSKLFILDIDGMKVFAKIGILDMYLFLSWSAVALHASSSINNMLKSTNLGENMLAK